MTPQQCELEGLKAYTDSFASGSWLSDKLVRPCCLSVRGDSALGCNMHRNFTISGGAAHGPGWGSEQPSPDAIALLTRRLRRWATLPELAIMQHWC